MFDPGLYGSYLSPLPIISLRRRGLVLPFDCVLAIVWASVPLPHCAVVRL